MDRRILRSIPSAAVLLVLAGVLLLAASACSTKTSGSSSSSTETSPTTGIGQIKAKVDSAAVAADLRIALQNAQAAAVANLSSGTAADAKKAVQDAWNKALEDLAKKYNTTVAQIKDVAKQYGISP